MPHVSLWVCETRSTMCVLLNMTQYMFNNSQISKTEDHIKQHPSYDLVSCEIWYCYSYFHNLLSVLCLSLELIGPATENLVVQSRSTRGWAMWVEGTLTLTPNFEEPGCVWEQAIEHIHLPLNNHFCLDFWRDESVRSWWDKKDLERWVLKHGHLKYWQSGTRAGPLLQKSCKVGEIKIYRKAYN